MGKHQRRCSRAVAALFTQLQEKVGGAFVYVCVARLTSVMEVMSHWG